MNGVGKQAEEEEAGDGRHGRRAVVAIGGNALSPAGESARIANQFRHTRQSLSSVVDLISDGWGVAVVHGNGPQVGDELVRNERARDDVAPSPLGVLVASTAGWIGYMIQQSLENALEREGLDREVATMVTQTRVERDDPALDEPVKFIGRELADEAAAEEVAGPLMEVARDDRGRLRRRVASPQPVEIVESSLVEELVSRGEVVIAAGGGGVPVYRDPGLGLEGLDVVIDKDRAAALLASEIDARLLLILTDVDGVYEKFGTPDARKIDRLELPRARQMLEGGELGEGSMRPKVEAAVNFLGAGGRRAVIAALEDAGPAVDGRAGTEIVLPEA